ncbi:hypothetical protein O7599_19870 [Streptomyces sp. WMMC500]|uniref:hypothetical protein n=1 Tax=Streptomyces sp. WMMC500 TaxID=3015154 RepID=UPI00248B488D|nr:hypothetical protein [Streptomyces sp. WMMC500]WBB57929.1 hypothetical protein O7599_19870 [Streptomyces sp. WMMC500]
MDISRLSEASPWRTFRWYSGQRHYSGTYWFNRAILEFYAHPGRFRGTAADFGYRALDCILSSGAELVIVDDLYFLKFRHRNGAEVSNHFNYLANEFPVTLLLIGVGLAKKGLFDEGEDYEDAVVAQTGRRTTRLGMEPFGITNNKGRRDWRDLLLAVEQRVVLADKHPGMIADELSDYLFARSTGHIGSLMTLINRGCQKAVRTGAERLDEELLNTVKNDAASERARRELERPSPEGSAPAAPASGQHEPPAHPAPALGTAARGSAGLVVRSARAPAAHPAGRAAAAARTAPAGIPKAHPRHPVRVDGHAARAQDRHAQRCHPHPTGDDHHDDAGRLRRTGSAHRPRHPARQPEAPSGITSSGPSVTCKVPPRPVRKPRVRWLSILDPTGV